MRKPRQCQTKSHQQTRMVRTSDWDSIDLIRLIHSFIHRHQDDHHDNNRQQQQQQQQQEIRLQNNNSSAN